MPIAAMPAPIVTSLTDGSARSTTGINVKWSLPTAPLCEQPAPDGCSGAVMFEIHVKTESGANSVLSCGNWYIHWLARKAYFATLVHLTAPPSPPPPLSLLLSPLPNSS